MIKDTIILFLIILYISSFSLWIYFLYRSIKKKPQIKSKLYAINVTGFVMFTYLVSFLILEVLS